MLVLIAVLLALALAGGHALGYGPTTLVTAGWVALKTWWARVWARR